MTRFIFITGGVVSSLGKGLCTAALGALLQARGFEVRLRKLDPYLNVDPGTMSPYQHGEVFVTDDGAETDLDLGHYERYVGSRRGKQRQRHDRADLFDRDRAGAARRISRRDRAGDPARHRRDQGIHHRRPRRRGFRAVRDRRHGRRHRKPAVPRGDPPARQRTRPRARDVRASDAGAVDRLGRRTQDQADPAFRQGIARSRHPARHPAVPLRPADPGRRRKKIALFCNLRELRVIPAIDVDTIYAVPVVSRRGVRPRGLRPFRPVAPEPDLARWTRSSAASAGRRARSASPSSASTRTCSTATNRWARR